MLRLSRHYNIYSLFSVFFYEHILFFISFFGIFYYSGTVLTRDANLGSPCGEMTIKSLEILVIPAKISCLLKFSHPCFSLSSTKHSKSCLVHFGVLLQRLSTAQPIHSLCRQASSCQTSSRVKGLQCRRWVSHFLQQRCLGSFVCVTCICPTVGAVFLLWRPHPRPHIFLACFEKQTEGLNLAQ